MLRIQWRISIGLNQCPLFLLSVLQLREERFVILIILILRADGIPHLQKHHGEITHRISGDFYARILPITVRMGDIEILVGQVVAAGKSHLAVHYRNLPMISVIEEHVHQRDDRVEHPALDSAGTHLSDKVRVDESDAADIVVENSHIQSFGRLFRENLFDFRKGFGILNGMILHEDEFFRLSKRLFLRLQGIRRTGKELDVAVIVYRKRGMPGDIPGHIGHGIVLLFHFL